MCTDNYFTDADRVAWNRDREAVRIIDARETFHPRSSEKGRGAELSSSAKRS